MNYREMREESGMKRSMRFAAVMMAAVMTVGTASTAMAAEWKHDSKGWWWQNDDGTYPAASWQWLDGNHDGAWGVNGAVQTKVFKLGVFSTEFKIKREEPVTPYGTTGRL